MTEPSIVKGVIPYMSLQGRCAEAAEFYGRAFGAVEIMRMPGPKGSEGFAHLHLQINGGSLMMSDFNSDPEYRFEPAPTVFMQLVVDDGDLWWTRAVDAGAEPLSPMKLEFWGDRYGSVRDPLGFVWGINEPAKR